MSHKLKFHHHRFPDWTSVTNVTVVNKIKKLVIFWHNPPTLSSLHCSIFVLKIYMVLAVQNTLTNETKFEMNWAIDNARRNIIQESMIKY